jgi:ABC-type sugar transport system substrate-binding protein
MMQRVHPIAMFQNFEDKREIDKVLERLDTRGVSRRDLLKLVSAGAALTLGSPLMAACGGRGGGASVASKSGKMAFLIMTNRLQYDVEMNAAANTVAEKLGYTYSGLNGELNAELQLNQFRQVVASGHKVVLVHSPDGSNIRQIATEAQQQQAYVDNVWGTLPWFTPWEAGEYYTLYAQPDEFKVHGEATRVLCEALGGKGNIVRVTGVPGNTADIIRTAGADAVLKEYPNIHLVGELPGNWNSEDSQKAMETLLAKHSDIRGVIPQNDDQSTGVVAALKAAGLKPGKDVLLIGADGTELAAQRIKSGEQLATTANVPGYAGYLLVTRLYDVTHEWKPNDAERMMQWESIILTKANVDPYLDRYVGKPPDRLFNADLMSHVLHPDDWDPQFLLYPQDLDILWVNIPKPSGWEYPEPYVKGRESGLFDEVAKEYREHYKSDVLDPVPL